MGARVRDVVLALACVFSLSACGSGSNGNGQVRLRGRVPTSTAFRVRGANASALSGRDAVKVIVTKGDSYEVRPIVGGAFDVEVPSDRTVGLILVGPADEYLGFVSVRGTIPGVPVQAVDDGVTTIDLGTLVDDAAGLSPGVDPIGHGITLDEAELSALASLGALARSVLAHPDVDGNGVVDLLEGREFAPQVGVFRSGAMSGLSAVSVGPVENWSLGWQVAEQDAVSYPPTVFTTGPVGSNVVSLETSARFGNSQNALYGVPLPSPSLPPPVGTWSVVYGTRTLTFELPELAPIAAGAPAVLPTVTLNPDQTIQSLAWTWRLPDGSTTSTPSNLVAAVKLQINAASGAPRCAASNLTAFDPTIVYAMRVEPDEPVHRLACQDIPWSAVTSLQVGFTDVYGTDHFVGYPIP